MSESDGNDSECTQDSNRESSGEFIAINSSILAGLKHGSAAERRREEERYKVNGLYNHEQVFILVVE